MGKNVSKRNSKIYKAQIPQIADQYSQDQAPDSLVLQASATADYYGYQTLQPQAIPIYTPNSSADSLDYYLPLPQNSSDDQAANSPNSPGIIGDDILSALKKQAAGKIALSQVGAQYQSLRA